MWVEFYGQSEFNTTKLHYGVRYHEDDVVCVYGDGNKEEAELIVDNARERDGLECKLVKLTLNVEEC